MRMTDQLAAQCRIILGKTETGEYIKDQTHRHALIVGPTGCGKTASIVVPTLLRGWLHSFVCYDRKGAIFARTSKTVGQRAHILKLDFTDPKSVRFNPLAEIPNDETTVGAVQNLMTILFKTDSGAFWDLAAYQYAVAVTLHLLYGDKPEQKTLGGVRRFIARGDSGANEIITAEAHPLAVQTAREMFAASGGEDKAGAMRQSIYSTAGVALQVFDENMVDHLTSESEFSLSDLMCAENPCALYLIVRPTDNKRLRPLLRLILLQIQATLMAEVDCALDGRVKQHPLLFVLDEFTQLGRLEELENSAADMREYGLRALYATQAMQMVRQTYGDDNALIPNCGIKVFFRPDDMKEAEQVSYWVGQAEEEQQRTTLSGPAFWGRLFGARNASVSTAPVRKLVFPAEAVMSMGDDETVLCLGAMRVRGRRLISYAHPKWQPMLGKVDDLREVDGSYMDLPDQTTRNHWAEVNATVAPAKKRAKVKL